MAYIKDIIGPKIIADFEGNMQGFVEIALNFACIGLKIGEFTRIIKNFGKEYVIEVSPRLKADLESSNQHLNGFIGEIGSWNSW